MLKGTSTVKEQFSEFSLYFESLLNNSVCKFFFFNIVVVTFVIAGVAAWSIKLNTFL